MISLDLNQLFPFELDQFQLEAIAALEAGKSVVVAAPTGSGKTLIGEYVIYQALATKRQVFYTTPLKALSNQKLRDFREQFGADNVGLLTGDVSINRHAPVLVMTTEIFRNMLYGINVSDPVAMAVNDAIEAEGAESISPPEPAVNLKDALANLAAVVLDECHYMNDRQRGTVWEESIIYCPPSIQLVALSATIANSAQLTDWINQVHGPTALISSDYRPVPLQFHFCNNKGLAPLLDQKRQKLNPKLKGDRNRRSQQFRGRGRRNEPSLGFVVSQLAQRQMLPAIYFIFSRRGCDLAVTEMDKVPLVNADEAARLKEQIDAFLSANPDAGRAGQVQALYKGIAAHHAGILPAWKGLVEELFQQGLIKVVFATETLAAGINMPARTTVISSLSKRTDNGHRLLNASEFLQMAGRAGRRGMDRVGYVVTVQTRFEGAKDAAFLATADADPLMSHFTPSYGMVLNLLQTHTLEKAQELIERSFSRYLSDIVLAPQEQVLADKETRIAKLEQELAGVDISLLKDYEKLRDRLREAKRLRKILIQQAEEQRLSELATYLPYVLSGTIARVKISKKVTMAAVIVAKVPGAGQFPWYICLTEDNRFLVASYKDIVLVGEPIAETDATLAAIEIPPELIVKPGQTLKGDEKSLAIAHLIPNLEMPEYPPEVLQQQAAVLAIEARLNEHPANQYGDVGSISKKLRKSDELNRELEFQRNVLNQRRRKQWDEFMALVEILRSFDYLENLKPTAAGQAAAALRGDNELWLALAMRSGELDELDPHHLATVCAALVTENSRSDTWVNLGISPTVEEALTELHDIRRQLFRMQRKQMVAIPIWLDYDLVGLIEQWALGMEWTELCSHTSLDEGDVVRIARRTLDLLSQIPHVPFLPNSLKQSAKQAAQLIDRFPISEVI
ncbi:DSH domain protein [Thalassoporum mexicanum PCC 7367]|uniref:DEAD/DEAH box helicase n=1 Tax=Thalassoporum mexicanum TaxID=3457544 RepID=UPI00029F94BE|nr:DEAD/DEAH box helicase [Pseudanabaena sp. PCC 7367]AFY71632.1 DSH domain protein [Pseudanabaena sp. PCC 7367]